MLSVAAPTGVTAMGASPTSIQVQWNASPDPTVAGYDVFSEQWVSSGGGKGTHPGHLVISAVGTNLTGTSDIVAGLVPGSAHTYVVAALSPAGMSPYSAPVSAQTWVAPSLPYGSAFLLPSGALFTSPMTVTAGLTTQIKLLAGGNPLTYSVQSGPSTVSVDPSSGVVTYTPGLSEVGTVPITFMVSNTLGSATQTITFNVAAPDLGKAQPTLTLTGTMQTFDGTAEQVGATAIGGDGVTPVAGTFSVAYNGSTAPPTKVGTYGVLATFTSSDPNYRDATTLGTLTITKATPAFSSLSSPTTASFSLPGDANLDGKVGFADLLAVAGNYLHANASWSQGDFNGDGTVGFDDLLIVAENYGKSAPVPAPVAITGRLAAGQAYPAGDSVVVTFNGKVQAAAIDAYGNFTADIPAGSLPPGTYTISYSFPGDSNLNAVTGQSQVTVIPTAPPQVTTNPTNATSTEGDLVSLTAAATGSPPPSVQWQVSTDNGLTFTDISGATSDTYSFVSNETQNGNWYRAVFTNAVGTAATSAAKLIVETDTGGTGA